MHHCKISVHIVIVQPCTCQVSPKYKLILNLRTYTMKDDDCYVGFDFFFFLVLFYLKFRMVVDYLVELYQTPVRRLRYNTAGWFFWIWFCWDEWVCVSARRESHCRFCVLQGWGGVGGRGPHIGGAAPGWEAPSSWSRHGPDAEAPHAGVGKVSAT